MTLAGEGAWHLLIIITLYLTTLAPTTTKVDFHGDPSLVVDIRVASKIWELRDQHSLGSLPPERSVEKRAWVRG